MANINKKTATALFRGLTRILKYDTSVDKAQRDLVIQISVGTGARGRKDIVESLKAG